MLESNIELRHHCNNLCVPMIQFEIFGKPAVYKKPRQGKGGFYDPGRQDKEKIRWQLMPYAPKQPFSCFVEVQYTFYIAIPLQTSRIRKQQMLDHIIMPRRPDLDNLAYILNNAMTGIIYEDDCLVYKETHEKFYGEEPKSVVKIIPKWDVSCE